MQIQTDSEGFNSCMGYSLLSPPRQRPRAPGCAGGKPMTYKAPCGCSVTQTFTDDGWRRRSWHYCNHPKHNDKSKLQRQLKENLKKYPVGHIFGMGIPKPEDNFPWPYKTLEQWTGQPQKVCYRALERAAERDLIDYGVSLRTGWLTDKGRALLDGGKDQTKGVTK